MQADGSKLRLHRLHSENPRANIAEQEKDIAEKYTGELTAIWNTIRYMRENNKPEAAHTPR
jgi:hypothetical protein